MAGKAALVPAGDDPRSGARNADLAGASAVVLYGTSLPSGALGLDENVTVPVVGIPARVGREASARLSRGEDVRGLDRASPSRSPIPTEARSPPSPPRGLSFVGEIKPNLVAPGVGIASADAGTTESGYPAFATVSGSSAAAAVVAGAAALLTQARPDLSESELRSLLGDERDDGSRVTLSRRRAWACSICQRPARPLSPSNRSRSRFRSCAARESRRRSSSVCEISIPTSCAVALSASREDGPNGCGSGSRRVASSIRGRHRRKIKLRVDLVGESRGSSAQGTVTLLLSNGQVLHVPWTAPLRLGP